MEKITFKNGQAPYINDTNLNKLQDNIENEINKLDKCFKRVEGLPNKDFNDNFEDGIYWYNATCTNIPSEQYGVILVISSPLGNKNETDYWWTIQIAFSTSNNIFIRNTADGKNWTNWIKK